MQNQSSDNLLLLIVTPDSDPVRLECDSIRLPLSDDPKGKGGGAYGIRRGHENALLSLEQGKVTAFRKGEPIGQYTCREGFARIENNTVTVVTEGAAILK